MRLVSKHEAELDVVIDFSCLAYRVYYSKTKEDKIEYLQSLVLRILNQVPNLKIHLIFALDGDFLSKCLYDNTYKGNRKRSDFNPKEEYLSAIDIFKCSTIKNNSEEADDVIASYVAKNKERNIIIFTKDSDLGVLNFHAQCIVLDINSFKLKSGERVFKGLILENKHITHFKAVFGDVSDNVKPISARLSKKEIVPVLWEAGGDDQKLSTLLHAKLELMGNSHAESTASILKLKRNLVLVSIRSDLNFDVVDIKPDFDEVPLQSKYIFLRRFLSGFVNVPERLGF
jgi:5'-3' exonuclease, N-terminal resolvase-like domain